MQELISFVKLYFNADYYSTNTLEVWMLLLYVNMFLYMADFYALVKRKSPWETFGILAIPYAASGLGAAMASLMVHVPMPGELGKFSRALESSSLNRMLLLMGLAYVLVWFLTLISQGRLSSGKRSKKEILRWVLSCALDYIYAAMIFFFSLWHQLTGQSFFMADREVILWMYLYAVYFLCCKLILLVLALLVRLYSVRLTVFKWKEGKNPSAFLFRYFLFYQSATFRNLLLFELLLVAPIIWILTDEGWSFELVEIVAFLCLLVVFMMGFSAGSAMKALERFQMWGEPRRMKELFCREYFTQDPLFKNENYTMTRHFLIDEQSPCTVYYWPVLKHITGWVIDEKERSRTIYFLDGTSCKVLKQEADSMAPVFAYAKRWQEGNERNGILPAESFYTKVMQAMVMIVVMAFVLFPHIFK